ncbi:amino acid transporter [Planoprotostelium fungivorum]|uniref:Amino acid transporter n=1 Tax=Planoprotostelium fungivorum TaxID=1890364 RepID=A0A2P6NLX0_9EUKA|nr:amino acid transporter [Planoprotostelium fungivorum]
MHWMKANLEVLKCQIPTLIRERTNHIMGQQTQTSSDPSSNAERAQPEERHLETSTLHQNATEMQIHVCEAEKPESEKPEVHTQRLLKTRHLSLIAIGGTIGSGLFLGSGSALATAGPIGALIGFSLMGLIVFSVVTSLGEMCAFLPGPGSFTNYASRFVDPALGFAVGWNYWYCNAITLPAELTAAAIVIQYWSSPVPIALWIGLFLFIIVSINMLGAGTFGEAEFWMALIKVITIVGLLILGFILVMGGGPTHEFIGFKHWNHPGPFHWIMIDSPTGCFLATCAVFIQAAFSYLGSEMVSVTCGEAQSPSTSIPRAAKRVLFRILVFYITSVLVIGLLVPFDDPRLLGKNHDASASPFVIFVERAKINVLPHIINGVILTSAVSAANSDLYSSSRTLYALAMEGKAPKFLTRCTSQGLPYYCVQLTAVMGVLAFLNVNHGAGQVFTWLVAFTVITGLIAWSVICLSYIRFHRALGVQGIDRGTLPYRSPLQPYSAWFGLVSCVIIIIFNGFTTFSPFVAVDFCASYLGVVSFFALFIGWKWTKKTKMVPLSEIDFKVTKGYESKEEKEGSKSRWEKVLEMIM